MIIKHQQSMRKILYIKTLFTHSWDSTGLNKVQPSFTQVFHHRKHGNNEVGNERMGGEMDHEF